MRRKASLDAKIAIDVGEPNDWELEQHQLFIAGAGMMRLLAALRWRVSMCACAKTNTSFPPIPHTHSLARTRAANNLKPLSTRGGEFPSFYWKKSPATSPSGRAHNKALNELSVGLEGDGEEPLLRSALKSPTRAEEKEGGKEGPPDGKDDAVGECDGQGEWRQQVLGEYLEWCAQKAQHKAKEVQAEAKAAPAPKPSVPTSEAKQAPPPKQEEGAAAPQPQEQPQPQAQLQRRGSSKPSKPRWEALYEDSKERAEQRNRLRQQEREAKQQVQASGWRRPSAGGRRNSAS
jgi:chemotaxis protein histidine kinase CheA